MDLAEGLTVRSGTGLLGVRLHARRAPEWSATEWVSEMDLNGD